MPDEPPKSRLHSLIDALNQIEANVLAFACVCVGGVLVLCKHQQEGSLLIGGGLGVKMAAPDREVYVLVGDGSYLMMAQELVTAVQENVKLTVVLVQNYGFASIGSLSESVGSQRFGTAYRYRNPATGRLDGSKLPLDLAANAESLGVFVLRAGTIDQLADALIVARSQAGPVLISIETDPEIPAPGSQSWWDVPVAEVSELATTARARTAYEADRARHTRYL